MSKSHNRISYSKSSKQVILNKYKASGLSVTDFCKNNHISKASFYKWQKEFDSRIFSGASNFIPVIQSDNIATTISSDVKVTLSNNNIIELSSGFKLSDFKILLGVLLNVK
jgi:transposase-like protein